MNATPPDAALLRILIETKEARCGIEVGTSTGYGAVNMGIALEKTAGHLTTIEIDPALVKAAQENIKLFGLQKTVTVVEGDALDILPTLAGHFDFVFLDAVKSDYHKYFQNLETKLRPGAVLVADNVILSADKMPDFLNFMKVSPDWEFVIIRASDEKGDGMAICRKIR